MVQSACSDPVLSACGFRQALVDHYSKLSAEAARREQKALWRIQRHRLESARLRFLLEDQKSIQVWWWWQMCLHTAAHLCLLVQGCRWHLLRLRLPAKPGQRVGSRASSICDG